MKRYLLSTLLCIVTWMLYAQVQEQLADKGQLFDMSSMSVPSIYETLNTVSSSERLEWDLTGWKYASGSYTTGSYMPNMRYSMVSSSIELPKISSNRERINLYLKESFAIESDHDMGLIQVSEDGGNSWQGVSQRSGILEHKSTMVNITSFAGATIQLRMLLVSDDTYEYEGWTIEGLEIKHEYLPDPNSRSVGASSRNARTMGTLTGTIKSLDAQRFPRFIFANVNVFDDGNPIGNLDESNFFVKEVMESPLDPTRKDTLSVAKNEYFRVYAPNGNDTVRKPVDIVFIIDNSGSMSSEQSAVAANVANFVNALDTSGYDYRLGITRFGQSANGGQPIYHDNARFYSDATTFINVWNAVNTIDGGTEPAWQAMYHSSSEFSFGPAAQKIFIHIGDEPMSGTNLQASSIKDQQEVADKLVESGITCYVLMQPGFYSDYQQIATATGGKMYNVTAPFNDILDDIGSEIENTYLVRYAPTNGAYDGKEREVEIQVSNNGDDLKLYGSYTPGVAPTVLRTDATLQLHTAGQPENNAVTIAVTTYDWKFPYPNDVTLYYKQTGSASDYQSVAMSKGSGSTTGTMEEATWSAEIVANNVSNPGITYYVTASDGDATTTAPEILDRPGYPWTFAVLPNVPPVVNHTPITTVDPKDNILFEAEVLDNTNNVAQVKLYYRTLDDVTFIERNMAHVSGNTYQYLLAALNVNTEIQYYIVGIDDFGVSTFSGLETAPYTIGVGQTVPANPTPFTHNIRFLGVGPFAASVTIGGAPIAVGDEIGVYYADDSSNLVLGGLYVWDGSVNYNLNAYGDNPATSEKDGFAQGEAFTFKIKRASDGKLLDADHLFYVPPSLTVFNSFRLSIVKELKAYEEQVTHLTAGLNLWSTYLEPKSNDLDDLFGDIASNVVSITDSYGNEYQPGGAGNTLTTHVPGYGLRIFTNAADTVVVKGVPLDPTSLTVNFSDVYGTILACPYPSKQNVELVIPPSNTDVFAVDRYTLDEFGYLNIESYSPMFGVNGWVDKNMYPGNGYLVFSFSSQSYTYPSAPGEYNARKLQLKGQEPHTVNFKADYMHLWIPDAVIKGLSSSGHLLKVYAKNKLIGEARIDDQGAWLIVDGNGIQEGDVLSLALYDAAEQMEHSLTPQKWSIGDGTYKNHGLMVAGSEDVESSFLEAAKTKVFPNPNPAQEEVNVLFTVAKKQQVIIDLINLNGQVVRSLSEKSFDKGIHSVTFNVEGISPDLYLIRIRKGGASESIKWMHGK